jgi:hypothetical protein
MDCVTAHCDSSQDILNFVLPSVIKTLPHYIELEEIQAEKKLSISVIISVEENNDFDLSLFGNLL